MQGARRGPWWYHGQAVQRRNVLSLPTLRDRQISLMRRCRLLIGYRPNGVAPPCLRGNLPRSRHAEYSDRLRFSGV